MKKVFCGALLMGLMTCMSAYAFGEKVEWDA